MANRKLRGLVAAFAFALSGQGAAEEAPLLLDQFIGSVNGACDETDTDAGLNRCREMAETNVLAMAKDYRSAFPEGHKDHELASRVLTKWCDNLVGAYKPSPDEDIVIKTRETIYNVGLCLDNMGALSNISGVPLDENRRDILNVHRFLLSGSLLVRKAEQKHREQQPAL